MSQYRKKPVVIEAMRFTGENGPEIKEWSLGRVAVAPKRLRIVTLEGAMYAKIGDWIIRGIQGEFYPCKPDIFAATYELVES